MNRSYRQKGRPDNASRAEPVTESCRCGRVYSFSYAIESTYLVESGVGYPEDGTAERVHKISEVDTQFRAELAEPEESLTCITPS